MAIPVRTIVLAFVDQERDRQEQLKVDGKFPYTCASIDGMTPEGKLAVLGEEYGEVAKHVTEQLIEAKRLDKVKLREEVVQVAACAVAWAEALTVEIDDFKADANRIYGKFGGGR